jgi:hypothetical protein
VRNSAVQNNTNFLGSGSNIVGLLTTPKYRALAGNGFESNYVSADFRGLSGPAVQLGTNKGAVDFAFRYRVEAELIPNGWGIAYDPSWLTSSNYNPRFAANLQINLNQIRLRFKWPVLANGKTGTGRQTFRTSASGALGFFPAFGTKVPLTEPQLYFIVPEDYIGR